MKFSKILRVCALSLCSSMLLTACSGSNEWTVNGKIEGAEGQTMLLEGSDNGRWFVIDTISINNTGQFIARHEAAGYPDIYRLRLGDKTLYFPIDSIETVTVVTKADAFDYDYTISGSQSAEMLMSADKKVMDALRSGVSLNTDSTLKRELGKILLGNPSGIVSYYIINKRVQGVPLFNPANKADLRIIGAVANAFNQFRPNDPRTRYLTNLFLTNKARQSTPTDTIAAPEIHLIDIDLIDNTGKRQRLEKVASDSRLVVLNFTAYTADFSPALNLVLNRIYEKYSGNGLQIYQVSVDPDEFQWRQSAKNLPWITVFNPSTDSRPLIDYNVGAVPATFIISNGEIVDRITDPSAIESAVAKRL